MSIFGAATKPPEVKDVEASLLHQRRSLHPARGRDSSHESRASRRRDGSRKKGSWRLGASRGGPGGERGASGGEGKPTWRRGARPSSESRFQGTKGLCYLPMALPRRSPPPDGAWTMRANNDPAGFSVPQADDGSLSLRRSSKSRPTASPASLSVPPATSSPSEAGRTRSGSLKLAPAGRAKGRRRTPTKVRFGYLYE